MKRFILALCILLFLGSCSSSNKVVSTDVLDEPPADLGNTFPDSNF